MTAQQEGGATLADTGAFAAIPGAEQPDSPQMAGGRVDALAEEVLRTAETPPASGLQGDHSDHRGAILTDDGEEEGAGVREYDAASANKKESAHLKLRAMHLGRREPDVIGGGSKGPSKWLQAQAEEAPALEADSGEVASADICGAQADGAEVELPPGTVWLLDYRAPGPGSARFASLGTNLSKFAIFLDTAVSGGQLEPPAVGSVQGVNGDGAPGADVGGLNGFPDEGLHLRATDWQRGEDTVLVVEDGVEAANAAAEKVKNGTGSASGARVSAVEAAEAATVAAAAANVAASGGRWAAKIATSTVEVKDEGIQESLKALWADGRLLSQESNATDVLRGGEVCGMLFWCGGVRRGRGKAYCRGSGEVPLG